MFMGYKQKILDEYTFDFEEFKRNFLKRREESAPYRERLRKSREVSRETLEMTFTV